MSVAVKKFGISHLRWGIALMLFGAAVLNYIDRQTLSLLAPTIQKDLQLTDVHYAWVVDCFLIAYTVAYLLSGRIVDRIGVRAAMAVFISWWSISNMLTVFAKTAGALGFVRFLLGLGEAGNWPGSTKAVAEWFPAKERAFAIGFYTLGATIGATLAPIIVLKIANTFHWQWAFLATGALGLLWVPLWLWMYRTPEKHPHITPRELQYIRDGQADLRANCEAASAPKRSEVQMWIAALQRKEVWALLAARFLTDPVWYFYQFWFIKYLSADRKLQQEELSSTWVVYLAADVGCILGGLGSGWLIRRGFGPAGSRLGVMLACGAAMFMSLMIPHVESMIAVLALSMLIVLAHMAWLSNLTALVVDRIPTTLVATCFGIIAAGSSIGGIVMNNVVVKLVDTQSTLVQGSAILSNMGSGYNVWFIIAAFLHPTAWLTLWLCGIGGTRRTTQPAFPVVIPQKTQATT